MYTYEENGKKILVPDGMSIIKLPVVSINTSVTNFFGVVMETQLVIKPESEISFYVEIPLDLGIFVTDGKRYRQMFVEERFPKKYSLYGSIQNGLIYRYWVSKVYEEPRDLENNLALTKVEVKNEDATIGDIRLIIFDVRYFSLFEYNNKIVGETLRVERLKKGLALVKSTNRPTINGARLMPHTPLDVIGKYVEMEEGT
ncbi:DUF432 domain-containing protein [Sulfolobus tengchongensis]|uniref:DUF432 domain-containing protein n=1 Tax=Sulfolobus tengchongensis TaxID=207809 RepID=A0AAX4KZH0_9CREN